MDTTHQTFGIIWSIIGIVVFARELRGDIEAHEKFSTAVDMAGIAVCIFILTQYAR